MTPHQALGYSLSKTSSPANQLLFSSSKPQPPMFQPSKDSKGGRPSCQDRYASASPAGPTNPGAASSIPPAWPTRRSSPTPPPSFPPSRSMEHFILSSDRPASPPGLQQTPPELRLRHQRQPLHHSHAPSPRRRAAAWQTSSPLACSHSVRNSARSSGSFRLTFSSSRDLA